MPMNNGIYKVLQYNIKESGFYCDTIAQVTSKEYKYPNSFLRFINFILKTFFFFNLKLYLISKRAQKNAASLSSTAYDLGVFIRPDAVNIDTIREFKRSCKKVVAYQWDGLNRYPNVHKYIDLFEDFYVFDKKDLKKNCRLKFKTNFRLRPYDEIFEPPICDAYFIGDVCLHRYNLLAKVADELSQASLLPIFFITRRPSGVALISPNIRISDAPITYNQNLLIARNVKVIVDITHKNLHAGLSLRFFEAMEFRKKLITTNREVLEYDFYHPNNIYVYGHSSISIDEFMRLPYCEIDYKITDKYKIKEWLEEFLI